MLTAYLHLFELLAKCGYQGPANSRNKLLVSNMHATVFCLQIYVDNDAKGEA